MLTSFQKHWGLEQWVAFLKHQEIPVLPVSRERLVQLREEKGDLISPRDLASLVYLDPYLSLKLLRRVEGHRSHTLGQDTTTALASVLQAGLDDLARTVNYGAACDANNPGLNACVDRAVLGERIARGWACQHADLSPDEVAMATLLSEIGELMLWHFAPELPQRAAEELRSGRAQRTAQAQTQTAGFLFKLLTLSLVQVWELPPLITQMIKGSDSLRANLARQALDTARHITKDPENPAIPSDIVAIGQLLPGVGVHKLIAHLPLSDEYKEKVLASIADDTYSKS